MDITTGALLRRIVAAPLSVAGHKLATIILDGMAWKDGYNGLERGTAAFTLNQLADAMGISRQHLNTLLAELTQSDLRLERSKPNGKFAPWIFRFNPKEAAGSGGTDLSSTAAASPLCESQHKTVFTGVIEIGSDPASRGWLTLIEAAKRALPCWDIDATAIWTRFLAFNRARGNTRVPAGFLLGFMRNWRRPPGAAVKSPEAQKASEVQDRVLADQIKAAPTSNWRFHASDLIRAIGQAAYDARVMRVTQQFGCPKFAAALAVHGQAVMAREIGR